MTDYKCECDDARCTHCGNDIDTERVAELELNESGYHQAVAGYKEREHELKQRITELGASFDGLNDMYNRQSTLASERYSRIAELEAERNEAQGMAVDQGLKLAKANAVIQVLAEALADGRHMWVHEPHELIEWAEQQAKEADIYKDSASNTRI